MQSPFVRVGAVVVCDECGHTFQIHASHVERRVLLPSITAQHNPLLAVVADLPPLPAANHPDHAPAPDTTGASPAGADPSAGSAPAAALTRPIPGRTPPADPARPAAAAPQQSLGPLHPPMQPNPGAPALSSSASAVRRQRLARARKKKSATLMVALSVAILLLAGVVLGILLYQLLGKRSDPTGGDGAQSHVQPVATNPGQNRTNLAGGSNSSTRNSRDVPQPAWLTMGLPEVAVEPIALASWQRVQRPFDPAPQGGPVRLTDAGRILTGSGPMFRVKVLASTFEPIITSTLRIELVDENSQVYAAAEPILLLLQAADQQTLNLPIPDELDKRMVQFDCSVKVGPKLPSGVRFRHVDVQSAVRGQQHVIRIEAENLSQQLTSAMFAIRALNLNEVVVGQYLLTYAQPVAPDQTLEFIVVTPLPAATQVDYWRVDAAGTPSVEP